MPGGVGATGRQAITELAPSVWQFTASLWETNAVVVSAGDRVLVFDPTLTPSETATIKAHADRVASHQHVFVTHSHFDHVCGIPDFPHAEIVAGEDTARAIRSGAAGAQLRTAGEEWGFSWSSALRVDRALPETAELRIGGSRVIAVVAKGNAADGRAYALPDEGVLIAGDYLQSVNYPCPGGHETERTYRRLLALLDRHPIRWVVSGHGRALNLEEARAAAADDLAYLEEVSRTAAEAVAADLSPREAQLAVYAVEPPRRALPAFEIYDQRNIVAWFALREARERSGAVSSFESAWQSLLLESLRRYGSHGVAGAPGPEDRP